MCVQLQQLVVIITHFPTFHIPAYVEYVFRIAKLQHVLLALYAHPVLEALSGCVTFQRIILWNIEAGTRSIHSQEHRLTRTHHAS
jgi:hypothetical protein